MNHWAGFDYDKHVRAYTRFDYYADNDGYIVWRRATGDNVELLHLRVRDIVQRTGKGSFLVKKMLEELLASPPYHSVFGFCLPHKREARAFYVKMGFTLTLVPHVYRVGSATLFSQTFAKLKEIHLGN